MECYELAIKLCSENVELLEWKVLYNVPLWQKMGQYSTFACNVLFIGLPFSSSC